MEKNVLKKPDFQKNPKFEGFFCTHGTSFISPQHLKICSITKEKPRLSNKKLYDVKNYYNIRTE